jgi:hypothetical protein
MVEARRVLLEALDALADHRGSLVLVGAQAVYLRTDEVALSFSASYTTDADLAIDPTTLAETPMLAELMTAAGFERTQPDRPGIWGSRSSWTAMTKSSLSISSFPKRSPDPDAAALASPAMASMLRVGLTGSKRCWSIGRQ